MADLNSPRQNHILDALPAAEYERLFPHLERVLMSLGEVLYESGDELHYVYFPATCIVSMLYVMHNGASAEIAMIGNEGIVGAAVFMGGETMPNRAIVKSEGYAFRMRRHQFLQVFNRYGGRRSGALHHLLLHYIQALMTQMAMTGVCNQHHSVDQRLCRCLLLSLDRISGNELTLTQELLANLLGVRRESVTEAAGKLQKVGSICYGHGHITVLDRPGLEARVCECYQVIKAENARLLPPPRADVLASCMRLMPCCQRY